MYNFLFLIFAIVLFFLRAYWLVHIGYPLSKVGQSCVVILFNIPRIQLTIATFEELGHSINRKSLRLHFCLKLKIFLFTPSGYMPSESSKAFKFFIACRTLTSGWLPRYLPKQHGGISVSLICQKSSSSFKALLQISPWKCNFPVE